MTASTRRALISILAQEWDDPALEALVRQMGQPRGTLVPSPWTGLPRAAR